MITTSPKLRTSDADEDSEHDDLIGINLRQLRLHKVNVYNGMSYDNVYNSAYVGMFRRLVRGGRSSWTKRR